MKKTFFSFLLLISAGMMAQEQKEVLLLDSIVESNEYGLQSKQTFTYNNRGEATDWLVYNYGADNAWTLDRTYRLSSTYNSNGQLAIRQEELQTTTGWALMSRTDYEYDEQGRVLTETQWSHSAQGTPWTHMSRNCFHYNEAGKVDTIYNQLANDKDWDPYMTMVTNTELSTDEMRVMDRLWAGFEEDGADGQQIYYFSIHTIETALPQVSNANRTASKRLVNGQVIINDHYTADGKYIR